MSDEPGDDELRRRRRAWIATHHPDRGGDPQQFAAGLARFDRPSPDPGTARAVPDPRPTVYRSRNPLRRLRRLLRSTDRSRSRRLL